MAYKVYKIQRTDIPEVVYIGITRNPILKRFEQHFREKICNKKKVNYLYKYRDFLEIACIEDNIKNLKDANNKEIFYIKKYRELGAPLLNATDGGDGTLNFKSWNKGLKCTYVEKLMQNSPNAKRVYSYDGDGFFLNEYNSIKKASEGMSIPRIAIKNIAELKKRYVTYKGFAFRYYKKDKIDIVRVSEEQRIKNVRAAILKKCKPIVIIDKALGKKHTFKNHIDCTNNFEIKKETLLTYLIINKETKKYKFYYGE